MNIHQTDYVSLIGEDGRPVSNQPGVGDIVKIDSGLDEGIYVISSDNLHFVEMFNLNRKKPILSKLVSKNRLVYTGISKSKVYSLLRIVNKHNAFTSKITKAKKFKFN